MEGIMRAKKNWFKTTCEFLTRAKTVRTDNGIRAISPPEDWRQDAISAWMWTTTVWAAYEVFDFPCSIPMDAQWAMMEHIGNFRKQ